MGRDRMNMAQGWLIRYGGYGYSRGLRHIWRRGPKVGPLLDGAVPHKMGEIREEPTNRI